MKTILFLLLVRLSTLIAAPHPSDLLRLIETPETLNYSSLKGMGFAELYHLIPGMIKE